MLGLCLAQSVSAQKIPADKVPSAVSAAFASKFPGAEPDWNKDGDEYDAEFKLQKDHFKASFTETGSWLQTETAVEESALPVAITEALKKDYPTYKLSEMSRIENANATTTYHTYLEQDTQALSLLYTVEGMELKKVVMTRKAMEDRKN